MVILGVYCHQKLFSFCKELTSALKIKIVWFTAKIEDFGDAGDDEIEFNDVYDGDDDEIEAVRLVHVH